MGVLSVKYISVTACSKSSSVMTGFMNITGLLRSQDVQSMFFHTQNANGLERSIIDTETIIDRTYSTDLKTLNDIQNVKYAISPQNKHLMITAKSTIIENPVPKLAQQ